MPRPHLTDTLLSDGAWVEAIARRRGCRIVTPVPGKRYAVSWKIQTGAIKQDQPLSVRYAVCRHPQSNALRES